MVRYAIFLGALFGLLAVAAGAFGAHLLENRLDADALAVWNLAARYQMYHALALLGIGLLAGSPRTGRMPAIAAGLMVFGVLIFSGSLYLLAVTGIGWLGAITPIGGTALILGWAALAVAAWPRRNSPGVDGSR